MYSVSNNYLNALAAPVKTFRLIGTVGTVSFDESNIIDISIDNQVSEGSEIKLGSVYTGVLTATFYGLTIARGSWVGKTITLSEGLLIDATNDTYEDVPLGIFTVAEANHTAEGVEVTAYDAMTNFDKTRNDLTDTGTAYAFLTLMCQKCGVTLGSTLADIQALPNGTETFSIYAENDIETWRDLLSWIAQTLGAVATIGRDGKLYLRQYSMTAAATIDETHRFTGCSFSDFVTYYTGMSVVDIALRQTEYKSEVVDDGLTYNLGSNPLVQGHYEYVQEIIDDFSNVALTPFDAQMLGGAIYDLCDCLTFSGGIAAGATCGVMGYTWKYNGAYSVKGFGANPALASAKSKTQKELEALYNTVGQEINEMSVVQNSTAVTIAENTETSILKYNFEVTQEENATMVDVSVVMTATATEQLVGEIYTLGDIVAALTFYVDNSQVTVYDPTFIVDEGKDTMTFNFSLSGLSVGAHEFDIRLTVGGGSGSIAAGDVHELLWGYGITFEVYVKSIAVTTPPIKTAYYPGEVYDYTGIEVDALYNNGVLADISGDAEYAPASGAVVPDEVGEVTVDVTYADNGNEFTADFLVNVLEWNETDFLLNGLQRNYEDGTSSLLLCERTNANVVNEVVLDFENRTGELSAAAEMVCSQPTGVSPGMLKAKVGEYDVVLVHEQPSTANLNSVAIFREGALISRQYFIEDINGTPADIFYRDGSGWSVSYSCFGSFSVVRFNPTYNSVILKTLGGSTIGTYNALWLTIENNKLHIVAGPDLPQYVVSTNYGNRNIYYTGNEAGYITADISTHTLTKTQTNTINNTTSGGSTRKEYVVFNSSGYYYTWNNETVQFVYVGRKAQNMTGVPTYNYALGKYVRVDQIGFYVATHKVQVDLILYDTLETDGVSKRIILEVDDLYNLNPAVGSMYFWNGDRLVVGCPVQSPGGVQGVRYYAYDFETETYQKQSFDTEA